MQLAHRHHAQVGLAARAPWGPSQPGLCWALPCWAGQMTQASGSSPGRRAWGPHPAVAARTEAARVTSHPRHTPPSGVGKASPGSCCSYRPDRG